MEWRARMKFEFCCKCDEPTGKAGAGEDSLYTAHEGPFCEDCFPEQSTEQEPVAWIEHHKAGDNLVWDEPHKGTPLYTSPPASVNEAPRAESEVPQRQPLTDEEIVKIASDPCLYIRGGDYRIDIARAIEAAHGIKGKNT